MFVNTQVPRHSHSKDVYNMSTGSDNVHIQCDEWSFTSESTMTVWNYTGV